MQTTSAVFLAIITLGFSAAVGYYLEYRYKVKEMETRVSLSQEETARLEIMHERTSYQGKVHH